MNRANAFPKLSPYGTLAVWAMASMLLLWMPPGIRCHAADAAGPILSASEIDYPPFCIVNPDGQADGFSVELMRSALKAMGKTVTFRTGPWTEVRGWLEQGVVQALPLVGRTPEREAIYDFTFPYMSLHGAIVVRNDTTNIHDLADLRGRTVAVMKGDNAEEFLRREERGIHIVTTATFDQALRELSGGRRDAVVIQRLVALRLIKETRLKNLKVINKPIEGFRQDFCFAVRKGDSATLALLNEGLALVMADGTYRHLHAKWFATLELPANRRIVVGGDRNYPPFEYLDTNGRPAGLNVDLTRAIAREMELDIEIRLGPWTEIVSSLERGDIDIIEGMFYSPERNRKFDFTAPYAHNHYVAVVRAAEGPAPTSAAELTGKGIVVEAGDIMNDYAIENGLTDRLSTVSTMEEALRELAEGKHDCALVSRITALYWIERYGWKHLLVARKPLASLEYCFAVPKGHQAMLTTFGEGLKMLEKNGEYRRIHEKWLGSYEAAAPTPMEILRSIVVWIGPLLAVLLALFVWTWTLRRQVAKRTGELRESETRYRMLAELAPVGIVILDLQGKLVYASPKCSALFGYSPQEMPSAEQWWQMTYPDADLRERARREWEAAVAKARETRSEIKPIESSVTCKDGSIRHIEFRMAATDMFNFIVFVDVSERKRAEVERDKVHDQLVQAQKLESVGRLAGGVAHDFNNMLGVIIGYGELVMAKSKPEDPIREDMEEILRAANRSAEIARQLLAFARKQTITPKVIDLNGTVEGMLKMMRRLIGEDIDLVWRPGSDIWPIKVDPSQIDQVLANLCVNARDAINGVGAIHIETANVHFDDTYCEDHPGFASGSYVCLSISDNGCGMDKETLAHLFEPFFTTKGIGQGTGLGLAMVYGIVKQNDGFINVYSEPGKGTAFRIYLRRHAETTEQPTTTPEAATVGGRGESIFVVEDEPSVLKMTRIILEGLGYNVMTAATPAEAERIVREHCSSIDLLITDVVMPAMNGKELATRLKAYRPKLKVLFMSGYTADVIANRGLLDKKTNFLQKPFSRQDLAATVRLILDR